MGSHRASAKAVSKRYLAAVTAVSFVPSSHSVLCERYATRMLCEPYVSLVTGLWPLHVCMRAVRACRFLLRVSEVSQRS